MWRPSRALLTTRRGSRRPEPAPVPPPSPENIGAGQRGPAPLLRRSSPTAKGKAAQNCPGQGHERRSIDPRPGGGSSNGERRPALDRGFGGRQGAAAGELV